MPKSIEVVSSRLEQFYQQWRELSATADDMNKDAGHWRRRIGAEQWDQLDDARRVEAIGAAKRKAEINTVMRYMHVISYFAALGRIEENSELLKFNKVLRDFSQEFEKLYGFKIHETRNADISPALSAKIAVAQEDGGQPLNAADAAELLALEGNYFRAQLGAAFRYGNFLEGIFRDDKALTSDEKAAIVKAIKEVSAKKNVDIQEDLRAIYASFKFAEKSSVVTRGETGLFDDLQLHAFLNQFATSEEMLLGCTEVLSDEAQFTELLKSLDGSLADRRVVRPEGKGKLTEAEQGDLQHSIVAHANKGMQLLGGLEIEALLKPLEGQEPVESSITRRNKMRTNMVDWNARAKKLDETKFTDGSTAYKGTPPKIIDMAKVLGKITFPESELDDGQLVELQGIDPLARESRAIDMFIGSNKTDISRENYTQIFNSIVGLRISDLESKDVLTEAEQKELANLVAFPVVSEESLDIKRRVASMTRQEALYYDLMFVTKANQEFNVELDGVYYPGKSELDNFRKVYGLIQSESFHEKTYDMIRATEFAIGPDPLDVLITKKQAYFHTIKFAANKHGLSFDDPNVQVNLSLTADNKQTGKAENIFMPNIIKGEDGVTKEVTVSALGVQYMQMMQDVVAKMAAEQGILRAQVGIDVQLDGKKVIRSDLKGSEFGKTDPTQSGFAQHRAEAAKGVTLRWSVIDKDAGVSVVEVRMIVNNPHFAYDDDGKKVIRAGGDFAPEEVIKRLMQRFGEFADSKTADEIQTLLNTSVQVGSDRKVVGLNPTEVAGVIARDPLNDHSKTIIDPKRAGVNQDAVVPCASTNVLGAAPLDIGSNLGIATST